MPPSDPVLFRITSAHRHALGTPSPSPPRRHQLISPSPLRPARERGNPSDQRCQAVGPASPKKAPPWIIPSQVIELWNHWPGENWRKIPPNVPSPRSKGDWATLPPGHPSRRRAARFLPLFTHPIDTACVALNSPSCSPRLASFIPAYAARHQFTQL